LPSNFSILTSLSSNAIAPAALKKARTALTTTFVTFEESPHYFSKLRFTRRKRNQIFSDVED